MSDADAPRRSCRQPDNAKPDADLCSKRCNVHPFELPCDYCGAPVTVTWASLDVVQPACSGCFGYPMCICREAHRGECPDRKDLKGFEAFTSYVRDQEEIENHVLSLVMKETSEVIARAPSSFFVAQIKSDE